ncbi:MAG TPA: MscL family protein, partial [Bacteroidia bacterium]|nr:MscL family protein [Bacteroidia bacterium]
MSFIKEFKEFAMRGNLIDFAVGVIVGGAFGKVTSSFVDGMVMPIIGKMVGGMNF